MAAIKKYDFPVGQTYLGLDIGIGSVGIACTDQTYNLLKRGNVPYYTSALFDAADTASSRRMNRSARHNRDHEKMRLGVVKKVFADKITEIDPRFFDRLNESYLSGDEKNEYAKYNIFADPSYTDKDFYKQYPTIFHLITDLMNDPNPHDVRLIYMALQYLVRHRGHANLSGDFDTGTLLADAFYDFVSCLETCDVDLGITDNEIFLDVLTRPVGIKEKKQLLSECTNPVKGENVNAKLLLDALCGSKVDYYKMFPNVQQISDVHSYSFGSDFEDASENIYSEFTEFADVIERAYILFQLSNVAKFLNGSKSISEAKVKRYENNKKDLRVLKTWVRKNCPEKYAFIFEDAKGDDCKNNFMAYIGKRKAGNTYNDRASREDFSKFLLANLPLLKDDSDPEIQLICKKIEDNTFYPLLRSGENAMVPRQLYNYEFNAIINNAATYLPFLLEMFDDKTRNIDALKMAFDFQIPYYVGSLGHGSNRTWAIRKENGNITPVNFTDKIDLAKTRVNFIDRIVGKDPYTGDAVLPRSSLLYTEFCILNTINTMRCDGKPLPTEVKEKLVRDYLLTIPKTVSRSAIAKWLAKNGFTKSDSVITGIDETVEVNAQPFKDFAGILEKTNNPALVDDIIQAVTVFNGDRKNLTVWLNENTTGLSSADKKKITSLKYKDWGKLSKRFLNGIVSVDKETGEIRTVIEEMRRTNVNLSQILSDAYGFANEASAYKYTTYGETTDIEDIMDEFYLCEPEKVTIRNVLRVTDEFITTLGESPKYIFLETTKADKSKTLKERTLNRKAVLIDRYKQKGPDGTVLAKKYPDVFADLLSETEANLQRKNVYLYYLQAGKCLYTGKRIDHADLSDNAKWDRDHIWPRSKTLDDSIINNLCLVDKYINENVKRANYPLPKEIQTSMKSFWRELKDCGLMGAEKYDRLVRTYALTEQELSGFVSADLNNVSKVMKAIISILKMMFPETQIVGVPAERVSDFRKNIIERVKFRELNNYHHAQDAYLSIVVGNCFTQKFNNRFTANPNYSLNAVFDRDITGAWNVTDDTCPLSKTIVANTIDMVKPNVTKLPKAQHGAMWKQTIMKKSDNKLQPKKAGQDTAIYGGYTSANVAYCSMIRYTNGEKSVIKLVPIYLYQVEKYEKDPQAFIESLGYVGTTVLNKKIPYGTTFKIGNTTLKLASCDGEVIYLYNAAELIVPYDVAMYIKSVVKEAERLLKIKDYHGAEKITAEKNIAVLDMFIAKCGSAILRRTHKDTGNPSAHTKLTKYREIFKDLSLEDQITAITMLLPAFQANSIKVNCNSVPGMKDAKIKGLLVTPKIKNDLTAYLKEGEKLQIVNQSIGGLFCSCVTV